MYSRKLTKDTHRKKEMDTSTHTITLKDTLLVSVHHHSNLCVPINLPNHRLDYHLSDLHDLPSNCHNQHIDLRNHRRHHVFPQSDRFFAQHELPHTDKHNVDNDHGCPDCHVSKC